MSGKSPSSRSLHKIHQQFHSISSPFNATRIKSTHPQRLSHFLLEEKLLTKWVDELVSVVSKRKNWYRASPGKSAHCIDPISGCWNRFREIVLITHARLESQIFRLLDKSYQLTFWKLLNRVLRSKIFNRIGIREENPRDVSARNRLELEEILRGKKGKESTPGKIDPFSLESSSVSLSQIRHVMKELDLNLLQLCKQMGNRPIDLLIKQEMLQFVQWSKWHVDDYGNWGESHFSCLISLFNRQVLKRKDDSNSVTFSQHSDSSSVQTVLDLVPYDRLALLKQINQLLCLEIQYPDDYVGSVDEKSWDMMKRSVRQLIHGHSLNSFGYHHCERMRIYRRFQEERTGNTPLDKLNLLGYMDMLLEEAQKTELEEQTTEDTIDDYFLAIIQFSMQSSANPISESFISSLDILIRTLFEQARRDSKLAMRLLNMLQEVKRWRIFEHRTGKFFATIVFWPFATRIWKESNSFTEKERDIISHGIHLLDGTIFPNKTKFKRTLGIQEHAVNVKIPSHHRESQYQEMNQSFSSSLVNTPAKEGASRQASGANDSSEQLLIEEEQQPSPLTKPIIPHSILLNDPEYRAVHTNVASSPRNKNHSS